MFLSSLATSLTTLLLAASPFVILSDYQYESSSSAGGGLAFGVICLMFVCTIVISVLLILIPMMKIFQKAGQPGWHAFVPILNSITVAHIVGREWWWGLIPYLNLVPMFELAKTFGKPNGFGVGIIFLPFVFIPMLGFGDAQYQLPPRPPLF
jgi:ABC-type sulfate transport system permease subunit